MTVHALLICQMKNTPQPFPGSILLPSVNGVDASVRLSLIEILALTLRIVLHATVIVHDYCRCSTPNHGPRAPGAAITKDVCHFHARF